MYHVICPRYSVYPFVSPVSQLIRVHITAYIFEKIPHLTLRKWVISFLTLKFFFISYLAPTSTFISILTFRLIFHPLNAMQKDHFPLPRCGPHRFYKADAITEICVCILKYGEGGQVSPCADTCSFEIFTLVYRHVQRVVDLAEACC